MKSLVKLGLVLCVLGLAPYGAYAEPGDHFGPPGRVGEPGRPGRDGMYPDQPGRTGPILPGRPAPDRHDRPDWPGRHDRPDMPGRPPMQTDVVTIQVNQTFNGFSALDISRLIGFQVGQRPIQTVSVRMAAQGSRGQATLMENGTPYEAAVAVQAGLLDYYFPVHFPFAAPQFELRMNGPIYVQSVTVQITGIVPQPPPLPPYGGQVLTQPVNQWYAGDNTVSLDQLFRLGAYRGREVTRVVVRARSDNANGAVSIFVDGRPGIQPYLVGVNSQEYVFPVGGRIGMGVNTLGLRVQGRVVLESVSIELR